MVFMGFVLGWQWTALRLAVGVIMVFGMAYLANHFVGSAELSSEVEESLLAQVKTDGNGSLWLRWLRELWQMSIRLLPEYALIVIVLGAARAWLFPQVTADVGNHALWIVGMAIAGTLFVIPTAGEIPIVQTLMSFGMGAGPAGALLTTLPPLSLPSIIMLARTFSYRVLLFITVTVIVLGILTGFVAVKLGF
jgi:uncharacterized membrane protein YraQ (UPF0718 family)